MKQYIWVGKIYPDWFREPLSPLEETWRLVELHRIVETFFHKKLYLKIPEDFYQIENGYIFIRKDIGAVVLQPGILCAFCKVIHEIKSTKKRFENELLPEYRGFFQEWQKEILERKSDQELWRFANTVMQKDVEYGLKMVYVGIYSFSFEPLLRLLYRWWIHDDPQGYQALLIGFENRTHEMNRALFGLSKLESGSLRFQEQFQRFISEFGSKKSDWELLLPTFGENQEAVLGLIELYRAHPDLDPEKRFAESVRIRREKEEFVKSHFQFPLARPLFDWVLGWAQSYVPLRETRQHYITAGGSIIRRALNILGQRHSLGENMIFYLRPDEVRQLIAGTINNESLKTAIQRRYELREQQKEQTPL